MFVNVTGVAPGRACRARCSPQPPGRGRGHPGHSLSQVRQPPPRHFTLEVTCTVHSPESSAPRSELVWGAVTVSGARLLAPVPATAARASACGRVPHSAHSATFPVVRVLFHLGLDFFQSISLVDLTHFLSTTSLKSLPASCPSRRTCKHGQQSPPAGPGRSVSTGQPRQSACPSIVHPSPTFLRPAPSVSRLGFRVQGFWGSAPPPGAPSPAGSVGLTRFCAGAGRGTERPRPRQASHWQEVWGVALLSALVRAAFTLCTPQAGGAGCLGLCLASSDVASATSPAPHIILKSGVGMGGWWSFSQSSCASCIPPAPCRAIPAASPRGPWPSEQKPQPFCTVSEGPPPPEAIAGGRRPAPVTGRGLAQTPQRAACTRGETGRMA